MNDLLVEFPTIIDIPVAWGEMDAFQHVNNIVYFRYFESARIAYFKAVGYTRLMKETGAGPILAETRCRYRIPLTFPDHLRVGARVIEMGSDRFKMAYRIVSQTHGKTAAEGDGLIVHFDYRRQEKSLLPSRLVDRIRTYEPAKPQPLDPAAPSENRLWPQVGGASDR